MTGKPESNDSYDLMTGAMDVTNEAIGNMQDTPVLKELVGIMQKFSSGRKFGVAVYADDPDTPHDYYTIRLHNAKFQLVAHGKDEVDIDWKVSTDYLRDINDNPREYIEKPWKLDVEWLKERIGDAA